MKDVEGTSKGLGRHQRLYAESYMLTSSAEPRNSQRVESRNRAAATGRKALLLGKRIRRCSRHALFSYNASWRDEMRFYFCSSCSIEVGSRAASHARKEPRFAFEPCRAAISTAGRAWRDGAGSAEECVARAISVHTHTMDGYQTDI